MSKIPVFAFIHTTDDSPDEVRALRKATREAVQRIRGTPIEASMEEVDESELDEDGYYPKKR